MTRGKKAAQAATRRLGDSTQQVEALNAELKRVKLEWQREVQGLRTQLIEAHQDVMRRASELAAAEVERLREVEEEERRRKGISDEIALNGLTRLDQLVRNACKYVSITKGIHPDEALQLVITWVTEEPFRGYGKDPKMWLLRAGLPPRGWTARVLGDIKGTWHKGIYRINERNGRFPVVPLDQALAEGHPDIHPDYNPKWYPRVRYVGLEIEESDEASA